MLNLKDSFDFLKSFPIAKYFLVKTEKDLQRIDFPYYMKASIAGHKTEEKAITRCRNLEEAKNTYLFLSKKFVGDIIIQKESEGIEMIIGLKKDTVFGRLLMIGFGGIFTEKIKDISFRAVPLDKKEIEKMLQELKFYSMLVSRKKYAIDKFVELALKVSRLEIHEMDLNPVILNEEEAVIVDARIEL